MILSKPDRLAQGLPGLDAGPVRGQQRRQGIVRIILAEQRPGHPARFFALVHDLEFGIVAGQRRRVPGRGWLPEAEQRRPASHLEHRVDRRTAAGGYDQAVARYGAHQVVKLPLELLDAGKYVRVVIFQVVDDQYIGTVVDEL